MSWKFVFNTTVGNKWWGHIDNANSVAKSSGYMFFTWNGWVYSVDGDITNIKETDLI